MRPAKSELDRFGRIVVPKATREELGLDSGTRFEVRAENGEIRLRPIRADEALELRSGLLVATGRPVGDLEAAVAADREERLSLLSGPSGRRPG